MLILFIDPNQGGKKGFLYTNFSLTMFSSRLILLVKIYDIIEGNKGKIICTANKIKMKMGYLLFSNPKV